MKTKKTVIAVVTATLLVSAMLIIGCLAPQIDEISVNNDEEIINYPIPPGKGIVKFKLNDKNVRTILPDFTQYEADGTNVGGMYFEVAFTRTTADANNGDIIYFPGDGNYDSGDGSTKDAKKASYADVTGPISLPNGNYSFSITAFNDDDGTITIAGYNSISDITVSTGEAGKHGPFTLIPNIGGVNDDGSPSKGTLAYDITIPAGSYPAGTAVVNIYDPSDLTTPLGDSFVLSGGQNNSSIDIVSGYYIVKVLVTKTHYLTRQYMEALHVYPGFTSTMDAINITLIQNEFEVSFDMNTASVTAVTLEVTNASNTAFDPQWINYAKKATAPINVGGAGLGADPNPDDSDYAFRGWYKEPIGINKMDFDDWILIDTPLYAKWGLNTGFSFDLMESPELMGIPAGSKSMTRQHLDGTDKITLTLAGPLVGGGGWDSITWYTDGGIDLSYYDDKLSIDIVNGYDAVSNIDFTPLFTGTGSTTFTISVIAKKGINMYSRIVNIAVSGLATQQK